MIRRSPVAETSFSRQASGISEHGGQVAATGRTAAASCQEHGAVGKVVHKRVQKLTSLQAS